MSDHDDFVPDNYHKPEDRPTTEGPLYFNSEQLEAAVNSLLKTVGASISLVVVNDGPRYCVMVMSKPDANPQAVEWFEGLAKSINSIL